MHMCTYAPPHPLVSTHTGPATIHPMRVQLCVHVCRTPFSTNPAVRVSEAWSGMICELLELEPFFSHPHPTPSYPKSTSPVSSAN
jgi:hypothetical protein